MKKQFFGTDGVRGIANDGLTPELAFKLGQAAGRVLHQEGLRPRVVMGRDTRRSGPMLGAALASGFCSVGVSVDAVGVAPTPTVSFLARTGDYGMGAIISASHNPAPDNGIKFVGHDGKKTTDETELAIEQLLDRTVDKRPVGKDIGELVTGMISLDRYLGYLESLVPERLDGLKVAVDAAHGAAFEIGPAILRRLGADVVATGVEPDGLNINQVGGATKPGTIQEFTVKNGCDIGVSFDGDADRAVFSDEKGRLINGDRVIGLWASHWRKEGRLNPCTVVGTVMTNGGFEHFMRAQGIALERTPVGDKYVSDKLFELGAQIGGEQSGHIIFRELGPTGDGLITMLEVLRILKREGVKPSHWVEAYEPWPQLLVNMTVNDKATWNQGPIVQEALKQAETALAQNGRLVVRASGTQAMVRVMVEAESEQLRDEVTARIVAAMEKEAGGKVAGRVDLTHALGD